MPADYNLMVAPFLFQLVGQKLQRWRLESGADVRRYRRRLLANIGVGKNLPCCLVGLLVARHPVMSRDPKNGNCVADLSKISRDGRVLATV